MSATLTDDKGVNSEKSQLDISSNDLSTLDYVDYIDEVNDNNTDSKYKALKTSLHKLLQQFENETVAGVNSSLSLCEDADELINGQQGSDKPFLITPFLLDAKEQSSSNKTTDDDWADYISRLGKLNKLLSSAPSLSVIPFSPRINKHLIISLNKNLPSGVHIKTLQLYLQIFGIIGLENLNHQIDLWIVSFLPIVQYCSLSVKPILLQIFNEWILKLDVDKLKLFLSPLLRSMFAGIDKDSDDFLTLINRLKEMVSDDCFFMSTFYKMLIEKDASSDIKMNGLIWLNDPSSESLEIATNNNLFLKGMISCLATSNDTLCIRGYLDYLIKKQVFVNDSRYFLTYVAKEKFIETILRLLLQKDVSLNRRIYQLLIPDSKEADDSFEFFKSYLLDLFIYNLENNFSSLEKVTLLKLIIIKWESIGVSIFKKTIISILHDAEVEDSSLIFNISQLFEIVDSTVILKCVLEQRDLSLIDLVVDIVKDDDEEMIVKHFPMLLMFLLTTSAIDFNLVLKILNRIPDRAFFTIEEKPVVSDCDLLKESDLVEVNRVIKDYYFKAQEKQYNLPYQISDLLIVSVYKCFNILLLSLKEMPIELKLVVEVFIMFYNKLPQFQEHSYIDHNKINNQLLVIFESVSKNVSYEHLISLIALYKTSVFNKTFKFDVSDLESINNSLNILKTFKAIVTNMIYPNLFPIDKTLEYVSILNSFMRVNNKFVNKFLLESFINDSVHSLDRKLSLFDTIIFSTGTSFLSFTNFIDYFLDSENQIIYNWLRYCIIDKHSGECLNKLLEHYATNLIESNENNFNASVEKLNNLIVHVLKDEVYRLEAECITTNMKILCKEKNLNFELKHVNTFKDLFIIILLNNIVHKKVLNISTIQCLKNAIEGNEYYIIKPLIEKCYKLFKKEVELFEGDDDYYNQVAVLLLNVLLKLVLNSNISDKNDIIIKYLDFVVSSIDLITNTEVLVAFVCLLKNSYAQLDKDSENDENFNKQVLFNIILPLGTTLLNKVDATFDKELENITGENSAFFSELVTAINQLFDNSKERLHYQNVGFINDTNKKNKNDFFSSVFLSNSARANTLTTIKNRLKINEQLLEQFFTMILKSFYKIWVSCNNTMKTLDQKKYYNNKSLVSIVYNYKHSIKAFLQKSFSENTDLFLELMIAGQIDTVDNIVTLVLSLDGNRPLLTIPSVLKLLDKQYNSSFLKFIKEYLMFLETSAVEEIYQILFEYFKASNNTSDCLLRIEIMSILGANSLSDSKKENMAYYELLNKLLANYYSSTDDSKLNYNLAVDSLFSLLAKDSNDILLNAIYTIFVAPLFKNGIENLDKDMLQFLIHITPHLAQHKGYKSNILSILNSAEYEIFASDDCWKQLLQCLLGTQILQSYPLDILLQLLNSKNTFNWSKQEILNKNIVILKKLAMILNLFSVPQIIPILLDYLLKTTDFNQMAMFVAQLDLLNTIIRNNLKEGLVVKSIELTELLRDSLRGFQHYYIHSRGSLNDLTASDEHDIGFCSLLHLVSENRDLFTDEDCLWIEMSKFKELVIVNENGDNTRVDTWLLVNEIADIEPFILHFDEILRKEMYDY